MDFGRGIVGLPEVGTSTLFKAPTQTRDVGGELSFLHDRAQYEARFMNEVALRLQDAP